MWEILSGKNAKLSLPVGDLKGIGPARSDTLREFGITSIADLILDLPRRYIHRKTARLLNEIEDGEDATALVWVVSSNFNRRGRRGTLKVDVRDDSGKAQLIFFKVPGWFAGKFEKGMKLLVWGILKIQDSRAVFVHPDFEISTGDQERIIPLYRPIENANGGKIGQILRQKLVHAAFGLIGNIEDPLPRQIRDNLCLPDLTETLITMHFPESWQRYSAARQRLAFDELFMLQLIFARRRYRAKNSSQAPIISPGRNYAEVFKRLPFKLTTGQNAALAGIMGDLTEPGRSLLLLSGDVGSGKTAVALLAACATADSGYQTAIIVPSLIVARQHADNIERLTRASGMTVGFLSGKSQSDGLLQRLGTGEVDIVIGTQALLSDKVRFAKLGLVIIDEQHLFGVQQRLDLPERESANILLLSATPIPRTKALALYGDLDTVEIPDHPAMRAGVKTFLRRSGKREAVWDFIDEKIRSDGRAFVVSPRIEGNDFTAAKFCYRALGKRFGNSVALIHGGLCEDEKHRVIVDFQSGKYPILAATSVISVGLDVQEATVMVIESADRFGLAQLHQLRGRVGRGKGQGYCILLTDKAIGHRSWLRLKRFAKTSDGFEIATLDLAERGEGMLLTFAQAGANDLRFADIHSMPEPVATAKSWAEKTIENDYDLALNENAGLLRGIRYIYNNRNVVESGA